VVRKSEGRIYYVDYTSAENLRKKYVIDPAVSVENIVNVDFSLEDGSLRELTSKVAPFDYVIASHVFEHLPNPIGWLLEIESLLVPGGVVSLAIPDKRYTFDLARRLTTVGDLLAYYFQRLRRPSPVQVFDHFLNVRKVDASRAWESELVASELPSMFPDESVLDLGRQSAEGKEYIDTHCTVWTAGHFQEVIQRLRGLGFLKLEVADFHWPERNTLEFHVTFRKPQG
jgi:SAM-dependent methyltransferase